MIGRAQADMPVQRQLAAAHPRTPVEQSIGDDHAVLARRTHRRNVLRGVAGHVKPHRPAVGTIEDTIDGAGGPRAGAAGGQLGQGFSRGISQLQPAGLLRAGGVDRIVAKHQLQVAGFFLPDELAVGGRGRDKPLPLRPGKEDVAIGTLDERRGGVTGHPKLGRAVAPDGFQQIAVGVPPGHPPRGCIEAAQELARTVVIDAAAAHADAAGVDVLVLAVMPEDLLGRRIDGQQGPAEAEIGPRVLVVVAFPHSPRPMAQPWCRRGLGGRSNLPAAHQRIQPLAVAGHPLPDRPVAHTRRDHDLVLQPAGAGVDQLARLIVTQVQGVRRGDHRIAMDHEAFVQRPLPKDRAVVAVNAQQGVQQGVLVRFVGNVAEGAEYAPAGRHRDLGHRAEQGRGEKVGQVGCPRRLVARERVVVGGVKDVAPRVRAGRIGLDDPPRAAQGDAVGVQNAQDFGIADRGLALGHEHGVGQILGQVQLGALLRIDEYLHAEQAGVGRRVAHLGCLLRPRGLKIDRPLAAAGQIDDRRRLAGFRQPDDGTQAAIDADLPQGRRRGGSGRLFGSGGSCRCGQQSHEQGNARKSDTWGPCVVHNASIDNHHVFHSRSSYRRHACCLAMGCRESPSGIYRHPA